MYLTEKLVYVDAVRLRARKKVIIVWIRNLEDVRLNLNDVGVFANDIGQQNILNRLTLIAVESDSTLNGQMSNHEIGF